MAHSHDHEHPHDHGHAGGSSRGRLAFAFALTCLMLVVEALGGWWSGSLALLADAAHMLVDAGALALAWAAAVYALKPPDARRSFGYARTEVLAGFVNALLQLLLVAGIAYEAIRRLLALDSIHIQSGVMLIVAADDDRHLSENIGLDAAQRAAESIGALLATPLPLEPETRSADSGTDFADIAPAEVAARIAHAGRYDHA